MEKAIIVARCSTNETRQDISRQIQDLELSYANSYSIVKAFSYYKSGLDNQQENSQILDFAMTNDIKHIIVCEVSRISRKISTFSLFLEECNKLQINIIINNYKLHTFINQKENNMAQAMLSIASVLAKNELELTKERLNSGRLHYIRNGGKLGRKINSKETEEQFMVKHSDIKKYINKGHSVREIMKLTDKSSGTIMKVRKQLLVNSN